MRVCAVGSIEGGRLSKLSGNLSKYRIPEMIHRPGRARNLKFSRERDAAANTSARVLALSFGWTMIFANTRYNIHAFVCVRVCGRVCVIRVAANIIYGCHV